MGRFLLAGEKKNLPFDEDFIIKCEILPETIKKMATGGFGTTYVAERLNGSKIIIKQGFGYGNFNLKKYGRLNNIQSFRTEYDFSKTVGEASDIIPNSYDSFISDAPTSIQSTQLGNTYSSHFKKFHIGVKDRKASSEECFTAYYTQEFADIDPQVRTHKLIHDSNNVDFGRYLYSFAKGVNDINTLGVVHKDIKPSNAIITKNGDLKIIDFGGAANAGTFFNLNRVYTNVYRSIDS
jgi:serine/threonine protein kinase